MTSDQSLDKIIEGIATLMAQPICEHRDFGKRLQTAMQDRGYALWTEDDDDGLRIKRIPGAAENTPGVETHKDGENVRISDPAVFDAYVRAAGWDGGTAEWEKDTGVSFDEVKGKWFPRLGYELHH